MKTAKLIVLIVLLSFLFSVSHRERYLQQYSWVHFTIRQMADGHHFMMSDFIDQSLERLISVANHQKAYSYLQGYFDGLRLFSKYHNINVRSAKYPSMTNMMHQHFNIFISGLEEVYDRELDKKAVWDTVWYERDFMNYYEARYRQITEGKR